MGIVWPTYVLIVVTCGVLIILMIILHAACRKGKEDET